MAIRPKLQNSLISQFAFGMILLTLTGCGSGQNSIEAKEKRLLELAQLYQLERQEQERLEREFPVEECLENDRKVNDWKLAKVAELKDSAHLFRRVEEVPGFSKELGELLDSHFEQCENCSIVQKQRRKARKVKEEKERLEAEIEKLKK